VWFLGVLKHTSKGPADMADATNTLSRATINHLVLPETTMKDAIDSGAVKIVGSQAKLEEMLSHLDTFDFWFNIVTP
jgi:alkyl sulfatase BDS1-like metallo-beta-lactamase superfamily hydrolase